ncbi:MAG: hypothetical protein AAGA44_15625 [Pseudomonadota bacterium]
MSDPSPDVVSPLPARRYRLRASRTPEARLRIIDLALDAELADWQGAIAERLLDCGLLPASLSAGGECFGCKNLIQRLALLAASDSLMKTDRFDDAVVELRPSADTGPGSCRLEQRLRALNLRLNSDAHSIARLLFRYAGRHLSTDDVTDLLGLRNAPVTRKRVNAVLNELVDKQVVQQLPVYGGPTFYDVDTRPHLHIYDRDSNTLRDADVHGIVDAESIATVFFGADATVTVLPGAANDTPRP